MTPRQLRRIRRHLGLSQAELAARLGVWTNTIWRWEAGQRAIPKPAAQLVETFRLPAEALDALAELVPKWAEDSHRWPQARQNAFWRALAELREEVARARARIESEKTTRRKIP